MGFIKETIDKLVTTYSPLTDECCTDTIIIEDEKKNLRSTAFNIKFPPSTLSTLKGREAEMLINGKSVDIPIRVSSSGYILFENDNEKSCSVVDRLSSKFRLKSRVEDEELTECGRLNKIRRENLESRMFFTKYYTLTYTFYYMVHEFTTMKEFLLSPTNLEFIYKHSINLYTSIYCRIKGISKSCSDSELPYSGCLNVELQYSTCLSSELKGESPISVFNESTTSDINRSSKCVILLRGCKLCKDILILPLDLYCEIYHFILYGIEKNKRNPKSRLSTFIKSILYEKRSDKLPVEDTYFTRYMDLEDLRKLDLKYGINTFTFRLKGVESEISGHVYFWRSTDKIIVSDFDGTITKSDIIGHVFGLLGKDYTHGGIAELFTRIVENGYKILYLTSRPMSYYQATVKYIRNIVQGGFSMPQGPILMSPCGIFSVIYKEVIRKEPHIFKIACLKEVQRLFDGVNPFISGFGNKITDSLSYQAVKIPDNSIYLVNHKGVVLQDGVETRYSSLQYFVNTIFPKYIHSEYKVEGIDLREFDTVTYWR